MKITASLLAILPFFLVTNASPVKSSQLALGALYIMTNAPSGNSILTAAIGLDGKLTIGSAVSTKGTGSVPIENGDPLAAQNIALVAGNRLYAVNPGSDTVSTFSINPLIPTEITLVGNPVNSGGNLPISIAVSPTGQVCVLNGGIINGVNCYRSDPIQGLIQIPNTNRQLHQNLIPTPLGIFNQPSQVLFSEDGTVLYAIVKGAPPDPTQPGYIAAWSVNLLTGGLSQSFVKSDTPLNGGLPFAMIPIPGTNAMIVPDVVAGYDIFDFVTPLSVATSTAFIIPNEIASCWVRHSPKTGHFYISDFKTGFITEISVDTKNLQPTIVTQYSLGADSLIDEEIIGTFFGNDFLYVLAPGTTSVAVLALQAPGKAPLIQQLDLTPFAKNGVVLNANFTQGLAIYNP